MQDMNAYEKLFFRIDGIYCERCVERITPALRSLDGIRPVFTAWAGPTK